MIFAQPFAQTMEPPEDISTPEDFDSNPNEILQQLVSLDMNRFLTGLEAACVYLQKQHNEQLCAAIAARMSEEEMIEPILEHLVDFTGSVPELPSAIVDKVKEYVIAENIDTFEMAIDILLNLNSEEQLHFLFERFWNEDSQSFVRLLLADKFKQHELGKADQANLFIVRNLTSAAFECKSISEAIRFIRVYEGIGHPCFLTALNHFASSEYDRIRTTAIPVLEQIASEYPEKAERYKTCLDCVFQNHIPQHIYETLQPLDPTADLNAAGMQEGSDAESREWYMNRNRVLLFQYRYGRSHLRYR